MKRHFYSVKRWLSMVSCAALTAGLVSVASFPATQAEAAQRAAATVHDVNLSLGEWDQVTDNFESWYTKQISPYYTSTARESLAQKSAGDLWEIKTDEDGSNPRLHRKAENADDIQDGNWYKGTVKIAVLAYKARAYTNFELELDYKQGVDTNNPYFAQIGFGLHPGDSTREPLMENGGYLMYFDQEGTPTVCGTGHTSTDGVGADGDGNIKGVQAGWPGNVREVHHVKLTVKNKQMTLQADNETPLVVKLPDSYDGGYIALAAGINQSEFSNLKIKELFTADTVTAVAPIEVAAGTAMDDLNLPDMVKVTLDDGQQVDFPVTWSCDTYDADKAGSYTFAGTLTVPEELEGRLLNAEAIARTTTTVILKKPHVIGEYPLNSLSDLKNENYFKSTYSPEIDPNKTGYTTPGSINVEDKWQIIGNRLVRKAEEGVTGAVEEETQRMALLTCVEKQYENFELDVDYKQGADSWKWAMIGFGATQPGKFASEEGGGFAVYTQQEGQAVLWSQDPGLTGKGEKDRIYGVMPEQSWGYGREDHHMKLVVERKQLKMFLDGSDEPALEIDLPETYQGGYIYLAAGVNQAEFANLKIVDKIVEDINIVSAEKVEDIVFDRSKDTMIRPALPATVKVQGSDGNEYICEVTWECAEFKTNKPGDYTFTGELKVPVNLKNPNEVKAQATVKVIVDYDPKTSVKYYFDSMDDLKDFTATYTPESDPTKNGYAGAGPIEFSSKWKIENGKIVRQAEEGLTDVVEEETQRMAILTYNVKKYRNFELEVDYLQGGNNWKWAMVGFGAQKPGHFATEGSYAAYLEMEGNMNYWGTELKDKTYAEKDRCAAGAADLGLAGTYNRNEWHHMKLVVKNGRATMYVDDCENAYTVDLGDSYNGGYIYLAAGVNQAQFDNLKITELNDKGEPIVTPSTGDISNLIVPAVATAVCGLLITVECLYIKRKKRSDNF